MGKHQESLRILEETYRKESGDWRIHHLFALNYVVLDIKEGAEASLENAIRLKPDNAELYYHLARLYYSENRPRESIAASRHALSLAPDYPDVYGNLGLCFEALAEDELAAANYGRAIELNRKLQRNDEWPLLNYASFLIKRGQTERAVSLLDEARQINPASAKAHYLLGRAFSKLGRNADAKEALAKSLALDEKDPGPHFELGKLLQREGDRKGARAHLSRFEALRKGAAK
jgi:tetratricopeptide (TPR) repeat protein